jgi:redox-sensitive bicupin YhaK (pirin superfamily)
MSNKNNEIRTPGQVQDMELLTIGDSFKAYCVTQQMLGKLIQPFIRLDHFYMSHPTFGEHPHQGIAAVTYMFEDSEGSFFNEDSQGDRSFINPGDLHWTQAGVGVRHNETPTEPGKVCHGIQMFVDLTPEDKSGPPCSFHIKASDIPQYIASTGARARVVLGSAFGLKSPLKLTRPINFFDVIVPSNQAMEHVIARDATAFLLMIKGSASFKPTGQIVQTQQAVAFEPAGTIIQIEAGSEEIQYILCIN